MNGRYLDKNYGGILVAWDRLFGSFFEEDDADPVVYGRRAPMRSFNPLWANLQVYRELWLDSWRARLGPQAARVAHAAGLAASRHGRALAEAGLRPRCGAARRGVH